MWERRSLHWGFLATGVPQGETLRLFEVLPPRTVAVPITKPSHVRRFAR